MPNKMIELKEAGWVEETRVDAYTGKHKKVMVKRGNLQELLLTKFKQDLDV